MPTIQDAASEVAQRLVDQRGGYDGRADLKIHDVEIAQLAALMMSERLGKSIEADSFFEKTIEFQTRAIALAQGHTQVIVLAGYAAFFTLWASMASSIPEWAMLVAGASMSLSLIVFIGWTVAGLCFAKIVTERTLAVYQDGPMDFQPRLAKAEMLNIAGRTKLMRWWGWIVGSAGASAFLASVVLAGSSAYSVAIKAISSAHKPPHLAGGGCYPPYIAVPASGAAVPRSP